MKKRNNSPTDKKQLTKKQALKDLEEYFNLLKDHHFHTNITYSVAMEDAAKKVREYL